ncbi:MAG: hypothetical protein AAFS06_17085 [Cyanobacteria bacterium J06631_12]
MPRQKRGSRTLEKAQRRLDGIKLISEKLDLGSGYTTANYGKRTAELRKLLSEYNQMLSQADALQSSVEDAERELADFSDHMLICVAAKFGKNSTQYEMAGGVRKSERKRPTRRAAAAAS